MLDKYQLPPGITEEQAEEIYRQRTRQYQRDYKRQHPDRVIEQRTRTYIRFLEQRGYTVTAPTNQEGSGS